MMPGDRFKRRDGLTIRPLPEGDAVVAAGQGETAVIVNAPAYALLDFLDQVRSGEEIADLFCRSFPDQDPAALRRDVAALVAELLQAGIVESCGAAPSTA